MFPRPNLIRESYQRPSVTTLYGVAAGTEGCL